MFGIGLTLQFSEEKKDDDPDKLVEELIPGVTVKGTAHIECSVMITVLTLSLFGQVLKSPWFWSSEYVGTMDDKGHCKFLTHCGEVPLYYI